MLDVTLSRCVCVRRVATACRISLGGEGNVLYPVHYKRVVSQAHATVVYPCVPTYSVRQKSIPVSCLPFSKQPLGIFT